MTLPASSAEKNALVPVIATLLQLSSAELSVVQAALKAPLWASLPVKAVKPRTAGLGNSSNGKYMTPESTATVTSTAKGVENSAVLSSNHAVATPVGSSARNKAYSPPPMQSTVKESAGQHPHHPMLDRSDTSDTLEIDLGGESTPEIHM